MSTQVDGTVTGVDADYAVHYTSATQYADGTMTTDEVEETWLDCAVTRRTLPLGAAEVSRSLYQNSVTRRG